MKSEFGIRPSASSGESKSEKIEKIAWTRVHDVMRVWDLSSLFELRPHKTPWQAVGAWNWNEVRERLRGIVDFKRLDLIRVSIVYNADFVRQFIGLVVNEANWAKTAIGHKVVGWEGAPRK